MAKKVAKTENETVLEKLKKEIKPLKTNKDKLFKFIDSDKFSTLSDKQQNLLRLQLKGMNTYFSALDERINDLDA